MHDEEIRALLEQQERCLRLAASCDRPEIVKELKVMAAEYTERMRRLVAPVRRREEDSRGMDGR